MIVVNDFEQGSEEWVQARLGILTSTSIASIVTSKGEPSKSREKTLRELIAEWISGEPDDRYSNRWMDRGTALEPEARDWYAFARGYTVSTCGIVYADEDRMLACSPDGLCADRGLEIKCPKGSTMVWYYQDPKRLVADYFMQVQGQMLVMPTYRKVDLVAYHPNMKPLIMTVERDVTLQARLREAVKAFLAELLAERARMVEAGYKEAA